MVTVEQINYLIEQAKRDAEIMQGCHSVVVQAYFNGKRAALVDLRESITRGEVK